MFKLNKQSGPRLDPHKETPRKKWNIKERNQRLVSNKYKLFGFIAFCLVLVLSLTIIPFNAWLTSGIAMRGITSIRGTSMEPTISDNEILFVQEVQFERGEIVMVQNDKYTNLLKRIVGMPGETVVIKADGVYINGTLLEESYTDSKLTLQENNKHNEIVLGEHEYYLLGDNRSVSYDSRHVGAFKDSSFLYSLTKEANNYTHWLMLSWGLIGLACLALIIVLPILLYVLLTKQPNTGYAQHQSGQKSKMSSKAKSKAKNKKKKNRKHR